MFYASPKQMRAVEAYSDAHGVTYRQLMENAGAAAAETVCRLVMKNGLNGGVLILCGNGNNGGDGFVLARNISDVGIKTYVVLTNGDPATELSAYEYCELSVCADVDVMDLNDNIDAVFRLFNSCSVIVDAVYGTGFHGELPPAVKACFAYASRCGKPIVALDVPSGGDCLTGEVSENTLKCTCTVTFGCMKTGMMSEPLHTLCGEVTIADIGFTEACFRSVEYIAEELEEKSVKQLFPPRAEDSYKNDFGHLLNIAGSRCMSGAAALSTTAALRSGAGLCTLASTEEVLGRISSLCPEAMVLPLSAGRDGSLSDKAAESVLKAAEKATAISIGCGLTVSNGAKAVVSALLSAELKCPVIVDADGINCLAASIDIIKNTKNKLIVTPHEGELKRLYKAAFEAEAPDRSAAATELAREFGIIVVSKGVPNYIAGDGRVLICRAGNPGLSRGGSGDVLAGMIAAFAAQGMLPFDAAAAGVFIHGKAADIAASQLSQTGMLPSDVVSRLPYVFKEWNR